MIFGSEVFGNPDIKMEGTLKNPNQYRDAIIFESLSSLPTNKIKEFIVSPEAKMMLTEGLISQETLDRLCAEKNNGILNTTVCHMAKENGDPLWDDFVKCHMQERRIMNKLLEKYAEGAKPFVESATKKFVEGCIPEYFRNA